MLIRQIQKLQTEFEELYLKYRHINSYLSRVKKG